MPVIVPGPLQSRNVSTLKSPLPSSLPPEKSKVAADTVHVSLTSRVPVDSLTVPAPVMVVVPVRLCVPPPNLTTFLSVVSNWPSVCVPPPAKFSVPLAERTSAELFSATPLSEHVPVPADLRIVPSLLMTGDPPG